MLPCRRSEPVRGCCLLLILIYSGFRISAIKTLKIDLEEGYFQGGVKTRASKNRIVPIHPLIRPAVIRLMNTYSGRLYRNEIEFRKELVKLRERLNIPNTHAARLQAHILMAV